MSGGTNIKFNMYENKLISDWAYNVVHICPDKKIGDIKKEISYLLGELQNKLPSTVTTICTPDNV